MGRHKKKTFTYKNEDDAIELVIAITTEECYNLYLCKQPYRNDNFASVEYVMRIILRNLDRYPDLFRMDNRVFLDFCFDLRQGNLWHDYQFVSVEEIVAIFWMIIGQKGQIK